jgi:hypothetical protein
VTYNNNSYTIDLLNDTFNFYIVGNTIDKAFVLYYLKFILKLDIDVNNLEEVVYSIAVCDQNANFLTITNDDVIVIEENEYKIKHNKNNKNNKENKENNENKETQDNIETDFVLT